MQITELSRPELIINSVLLSTHGAFQASIAVLLLEKLSRDRTANPASTVPAIYIQDVFAEMVQPETRFRIRDLSQVNESLQFLAHSWHTNVE